MTVSHLKKKVINLFNLNANLEVGQYTSQNCLDIGETVRSGIGIDIDLCNIHVVCKAQILLY